MPSRFRFEWRANFDPFHLSRQLASVGLERKLPQIQRAALNKTARRANTFARRAVAKGMGIAQRGLTQGGSGQRWKFVPANRAIGGRYRSQIIMRGRPTNVGSTAYKARQTKRGVSSRAWGKRRIYRGTFLLAKGRPGQFAVTRQPGSPRLKSIFGPWAPRQYTKGGRGSIQSRTVRHANRDYQAQVESQVYRVLATEARRRRSAPLRPVRA